MLTTLEAPQTNEQDQAQAWRSFNGGTWQDQIDVRDFIQQNYTPYSGDYAFLKGPTERTQKLWDQLKDLLEAERAATKPGSALSSCPA